MGRLSNWYTKIKCKCNIHELVTIARDNTFCTKYVDQDDFVKYWLMSFYECKHCKKRKFTTNHPTMERHNGMCAVKLNWIECRTLPSTATILRNDVTAKIMKFKAITGGKNDV